MRYLSQSKLNTAFFLNKYLFVCQISSPVGFMWLMFFLFPCFGNCFQTGSGRSCHWNTLVIINTCQWISLLANRPWKAVMQGFSVTERCQRGNPFIETAHVCHSWHHCHLCLSFFLKTFLRGGFCGRFFASAFETEDTWGLCAFTVALQRAWGGLSRGGLTRDFRVVRGTAFGNPRFGFQATGWMENALRRYYPS